MTDSEEWAWKQIRIDLAGVVANRRRWSPSRHESAHILEARRQNVVVQGAEVVKRAETAGRVFLGDKPVTEERKARSIRVNGRLQTDLRNAVPLLMLLENLQGWRAIRRRVLEICREVEGSLTGYREWHRLLALKRSLQENVEMDAAAIEKCIADADASFSWNTYLPSYGKERI